MVVWGGESATLKYHLLCRWLHSDQSYFNQRWTPWPAQPVYGKVFFDEVLRERWEAAPLQDGRLFRCRSLSRRVVAMVVGCVREGGVTELIAHCTSNMELYSIFRKIICSRFSDFPSSLAVFQNFPSTLRELAFLLCPFCSFRISRFFSTADPDFYHDRFTHILGSS